MIAQFPARETPQPPLHGGPGPCRPAVPDEPQLRIENIQGNILAGFNKDHQTLLFLEITNVPQFREWLQELAKFVATTAEVLAFNRLFKEIRSRRGDSRTVQATWMNLAFSARGLEKLAGKGELAKFKDEAFQAGLAKRSEGLGDPTYGEGSPDSWVVGGPKNKVDLVLIFAADDQHDLLEEVARIEDSIYNAHTQIHDHGHESVRCGVRVVYKQHGATLPPPLTGHEHFGFLDGVSQPGLRGRVSADSWDVLTPRQNPDEPDDQGKPGQDLLWPGEFVFGYPGQDPKKEVKEKGPDSLEPEPGKPVAPRWAQDGAYLVFRRLRQNVPGFHEFLHREAKNLGIDVDRLGSRVVGRWKSGAPTMISPDKDDPDLGGDDCRNNHFEFASDEEGEARQAMAPPANAPCQCEPERLPDPDDEGLKCPFAGHIRKAYPRNDENDEGLNESETQTHRLLRRGIPFGPPYPVDPPPHFEDTVDRGLLFLAYQTSIVDQFEFVQTKWCNNPDFKKPRSGHDLIIGQNGGPGHERYFTLPLKEGDQIVHKELRTEEDWVIPTGGGYFFAPSICALHQLAHGALPK